MRYPTDLTDKQWQVVKHLVDKPDLRRAVSVYDQREVVNAILSLNKSGWQWRMLPAHFPKWQNVCNHFRRMEARGVWQEVCWTLGELDGIGWNWMELDGIGWNWMELDGIGWNWMELDGIGGGVGLCEFRFHQLFSRSMRC